MKKLLEQVGLLVGGNPGALLLNVLGLGVSSDKFLRVVHALPMRPGVCSKEVGVDEFVLKRGLEYGPVIVNLETGRTVDLLPSRRYRDGKPMTQTTATHRSGCTRSLQRIRPCCYASTATRTASFRPMAFKNLRETLERELNQQVSLTDPPPI